MPRAGWTKPETDQRLSDHLAIAMLIRAYPPLVVDEVIAATHRLEERQRMLPARVVLYYVLAMSLFAEASYEEVMRRLLEGMAWQQRWSEPWQVPTKAAIFKARTRLGVEPVAELFHRTVRPLATPETAGAWYQGRPVITMDRFEVKLLGADRAGQGRSGTDPPPSTTLDLVGLIEGGTGAVLDIAVGALDSTRAPREGALYMADGHGATAAFRAEVARQGADLLWEADSRSTIRRIEDLPDGSHLAELIDDPVLGSPPIRLRLINATHQTAGPLLTTLVDPATAPATELHELYGQRTTLTSCLDDLRAHQSAPTLAPRSKSVDGALQEIYGLLLAHYAIRSLLIRPTS
jgi:hypothetical protein